MEVLDKVLVLIVTFNAEKWLDTCIHPIYKQLDILIIDNYSTDQTVEIIKRQYQDVYLIENKLNIGFGKANNIGLKYAIKHKYSHVLLLNQDARIDYQEVIKLIKKSNNNPEYGILSPLHKHTESVLDKRFEEYLSSTEDRLISNLIFSRNHFNSIYEVPFVNAAIWLLSGKCIKDVGGFDSLFYHYGEDDEFAQRVKYKNMKIGVDITTVGYHYRAQKVSGPVLFQVYKRDEKNRLLIRLKDLSKPLIYLALAESVHAISFSIKYLVRGKLNYSFVHLSNLFWIITLYNTLAKHRLESNHFYPFLRE